MSTLKVTNIQDTSGSHSSTSAEIYDGRAKAWVEFNGTGTVSIRDDYNVNTIGDNGVGDYTINFDTAMPNANYAKSGASTLHVGGGWSCVYFDAKNVSPYSQAPTTSNCRITTSYSGSTSNCNDSSRVSVIVWSTG